jgi:hypothetical protein
MMDVTFLKMNVQDYLPLLPTRDMRNVHDPAMMLGALVKVSGVFQAKIPNKRSQVSREVRKWHVILRPVTIGTMTFDHICVPNSRRIQDAMNGVRGGSGTLPGDILEFTTFLRTYEWKGTIRIGMRGAYARDVRVIAVPQGPPPTLPLMLRSDNDMELSPSPSHKSENHVGGPSHHREDSGDH